LCTSCHSHKSFTERGVYAKHPVRQGIGYQPWDGGDSGGVELEAFDMADLLVLDPGKPTEQAPTDEPEPGHPLCRLLLYRPTWNKKRSVRFLSLRKWRLPNKPEALGMLKVAKDSADADLVETIAREMSGPITEMLKATSMLVFTSPPAGHSAATGWQLAREVATRMAGDLGGSYWEAFEDRPRNKRSHPRHWAERGEIVLKSPPPDGALVVLVDDVATSGTTIEQCAAAIGALAPVLSLVWLYEEVTG